MGRGGGERGGEDPGMEVNGGEGVGRPGSAARFAFADSFTAEALDLYNTILDAMGTKRRPGPGNREHRSFDAILA